MRDDDQFGKPVFHPFLQDCFHADARVPKRACNARQNPRLIHNAQADVVPPWRSEICVHPPLGQILRRAGRIKPQADLPEQLNDVAHDRARRRQ